MHMHHLSHLVHDVYGNPSVDELIPAVLACILLASVLCMAALDFWKGRRRAGAVASPTSTSPTEEGAEAKRDYLD